jgi:hypothetical protein
MRLRAVRNNFLRGSLRQSLGWLAVALAVSAVDVAVFKAAPRSLALVGGAAHAGDGSLDLGQLFTSLISFFNVSFAMLFLASFPLTIGTYTYRSDLAILLPTPVQPRIVFAEKLLTGILRQYVIVVPLMAPYLLGLGVGLHLPAGFFVASALIILLMPIVPTCLGGILTFVFLTLFPPARARTLVTVGGAEQRRGLHARRATSVAGAVAALVARGGPDPGRAPSIPGLTRLRRVLRRRGAGLFRGRHLHRHTHIQ